MVFQDAGRSASVGWISSGLWTVAYANASIQPILQVLLLDMLVVLAKGRNSIGINLFRVEFTIRFNVPVVHSPLMLSHQDVVLLPLLLSLDLRGDILVIVDLLLIALLFLLLFAEYLIIHAQLNLVCVVLVSLPLYLLFLLIFLYLPEKFSRCLGLHLRSFVLLERLLSRFLLFLTQH